MDRDRAVRQHQEDSRRYRRNPSSMRQSDKDTAGQKSAQKTPKDKPASPKWSRLVQFCQRYPLALLLAAWTIFLLLAGLAFLDMTSLGTANLQAPDAAPIAASPTLSVQPSEVSTPAVPVPPNPQSGHNSLPLIALTAIALSCAGGCLIILQSLKPRRPPERSHSSVFSKPVSRQVSRRAKAPYAKASKFQQNTQSQPSNDPAIVPSVVPPDLSQPLDWDEPSLADNLDLRQKRPLSQWLQ